MKADFYMRRSPAGVTIMADDGVVANFSRTDGAVDGLSCMIMGMVTVGKTLYDEDLHYYVVDPAGRFNGRAA